MCFLPLLSQAIGQTCRESCELASPQLSTKHLAAMFVKDATGQALAYVYARETRADADTAKVLTMEEARCQQHRQPADGVSITERKYSAVVLAIASRDRFVPPIG